MPIQETGTSEVIYPEPFDEEEKQFFIDHPARFRQEYEKAFDLLFTVLENQPEGDRRVYLSRYLERKLVSYGIENIDKYGDNEPGEVSAGTRFHAYAEILVCGDEKILALVGDPTSVAREVFYFLDITDPLWRKHFVNFALPTWVYRESLSDISSVVVDPLVANRLTYYAVWREFLRRPESSTINTLITDSSLPPEDRAFLTALEVFGLRGQDPEPQKTESSLAKTATLEDTKAVELLKDFWLQSLAPYWVQLRRSNLESASPLAVSTRETVGRAIGPNPHDYYPDKEAAAALNASQLARQRADLGKAIRQLLTEFNPAHLLDPKIIEKTLARSTCEKILLQAGAWMQSQQVDPLAESHFRELSSLLFSTLKTELTGEVVEHIFGSNFETRSPIIQLSTILFTAYIRNGTTIKGAQTTIAQIEQRIIPALLSFKETQEQTKDKKTADHRAEIQLILDQWPKAQEVVEQNLERPFSSGLCSTSDPELLRRVSERVGLIEKVFNITQAQLVELGQDAMKQVPTRFPPTYQAAITALSYGVTVGLGFGLSAMTQYESFQEFDKIGVYGLLAIAFLSTLVSILFFLGMGKEQLQFSGEYGLRRKRVMQNLDMDILLELREQIKKKSQNEVFQLLFKHKYGSILFCVLLAAGTITLSEMANSNNNLPSPIFGDTWLDATPHSSEPNPGSSEESQSNTTFRKEISTDLESTADVPSLGGPVFYAYYLPQNAPIFWVQSLCYLDESSVSVECENQSLTETQLPVEEFGTTNELSERISREVSEGSIVRLNASTQNNRFEIPAGYKPHEVYVQGVSGATAEWSVAEGVAVHAENHIVAVVYAPLASISDLPVTNPNKEVDELDQSRPLEDWVWEHEFAVDIVDIRNWVLEQRDSDADVLEVLAGVKLRLEQLGYDYEIIDFAPDRTSQETLFLSFFAKDERGARRHGGFKCDQWAFIISEIMKSGGYSDIQLVAGFAHDPDYHWGGYDSQAHMLLGYVDNKSNSFRIFESTLPDVNNSSQSPKPPDDIPFPLESEQKRTDVTSMLLISLLTSLSVGLGSVGGGIALSRVGEKKRLESVIKQENSRRARQQHRQAMVEIVRSMDLQTQTAVFYGLIAVTGLLNARDDRVIPDEFYSFKQGGFVPATQEMALEIATEVQAMYQERPSRAPSLFKQRQIDEFISFLDNRSANWKERPHFAEAVLTNKLFGKKKVEKKNVDMLVRKLELLIAAMNEVNPQLAQIFKQISEI